MSASIDESTSPLPRGDSLAYHLTSQSLLSTIQAEGIRVNWAETTHRAVEEDYLRDISNQTGVDLPIDRRLAVYASLDAEEMEEFLADELNDVLAPQGCVVINLERVDAPLTIADTEPLMRLLDTYEPYYYGGADLDEATAESSAEAYLHSIQMVDSWTDLAEVTDSMADPELLVSGDVSPEAIVTTVCARPSGR